MREWMLPLVFSAVIVAVQILFAPMLTIFSVVPSFIVPFVFMLSVIRRPDTTYVYAFVLGLLSDLFAQTPVGLTSLLLLVASFALSRSFEVLDSSSPTMPVAAAAASALVFEVVFMIVLMVLGYQGSFIELLLYRALPHAIFDTLISLVLFFIMRRLPFMQATNDAWTVADNVRFR